MTKHTLNKTINALLAALAVTILSGCATDNRQASVSDRRSNLDEADRENHNSLLPASYYDSNHEIDD